MFESNEESHNYFSFLHTENGYRTDVHPPQLSVSCLSDGVQVTIIIRENEYNGIVYVKGHSKDEQCRQAIALPTGVSMMTEIFKVNFGSCGLIHINVSIILPKTYLLRLVIFSPDGRSKKLRQE